MQRGAFVKLAAEEEDDDGVGADGGRPSKLRFAAEHEGFNLHAGVHIAAGDDMGRERLCRYGLRPAMAQGNLRRLPDGRIALRVKYARAGRAKHRVMTPLEFLARLSAITPPPRFPLLRYSGVLAPNSPWRKDVVPKPREKVPCLPAGQAEKKKPAPKLGSGAKPAPHESARAPQSAPTTAWSGNAPLATRPGTPGPVREPSTSTPALRKTAGLLAPILLAPGILSVAHWDRLLGGLLYAASPRVNWALLLQRTFAVDALECPKCHGRMRVIAAIHEPEVASAMLDCLGISDEVPSCARARDPTDDDSQAYAAAN